MKKELGRNYYKELLGITLSHSQTPCLFLDSKLYLKLIYYTITYLLYLRLEFL